MVVNKGYSVYDLELEEIEKIIKEENDWEELIEGLNDKEIKEVLEIKEILNRKLKD